MINSKIEVVAIERLHPDPNNARRHPPRNMEAIKSSLTRFGQQVPVLARRDGLIVAGNGRYRAAVELGWTEIAVVWTDLVGEEATAYALADNHTTDLSEWDEGVFLQQLAALNNQGWDMGDYGFRPADLVPLLETATPRQYSTPPPENLLTLVATEQQYIVIKTACALIRATVSDPSLSDGYCLNLICADWLAGQDYLESP